MLHTATLVHDDVIDGADTRRGRPSANTTWGNSKCVLSGDWLYMQSFATALEERNFRVLELLISLTQQMKSKANSCRCRSWVISSTKKNTLT